MSCADRKHCNGGWIGLGDDECVNGVLIDIDVAHEGWQRDVSYPPGPCNACPYCDGAGALDDDDEPCTHCNETGWIGGVDLSQKLLTEWAERRIADWLNDAFAGDPA